MKTNITFKFPEGSLDLKMDYATKTFIHTWNGHKVLARKYDSPAPWLGNAVGNHPKPNSFIQVYCETCKEEHGITYLDRFNSEGEFIGDILNEEQRRKELEDFIN